MQSRKTSVSSEVRQLGHQLQHTITTPRFPQSSLLRQFVSENCPSRKNQLLAPSLASAYSNQSLDLARSPGRVRLDSTGQRGTARRRHADGVGAVLDNRREAEGVARTRDNTVKPFLSGSARRNDEKVRAGNPNPSLEIYHEQALRTAC